MPKNSHITFFTPTMQRTGSEIVLLNLLNHLSNDFQAILISKYKGPLLPMIQNGIDVSYLYSKQSNTILSKFIFKIKSNFINPLILKRFKNSIWYINTIVIPDILNFAAKNQIKVILHVHELEQMFALLSQEQLQQAIHYPDLIIANSNCTKQLIEQYGRTKSIEVCYPAIDTEKIQEDLLVKHQYRSKLHISKDSFVWVMCGSLDENKNPFLFMDIAKSILKDKPNTCFMWIGETKDAGFKYQCKQYAKEQGLGKSVLWIENSEADYLNYFTCADGFVLTSQRESFSIVTLEALLLGIPVVANDCGGVTEILKNDVGTVVKTKNQVVEFVDAMKLFMENPEINDKAKGIERAKSFDLSGCSKLWNNILNNYTK